MTRARTTIAERPRSLRAVTAVLALYALVLQAVLGGIAALPVAPAQNLAYEGLAYGLPFDVHCLQGDAGAGEGPAQPHGPSHHHPGCCTAAHLAAGTPPPLPVAAPVVWPPRLVTRLVWRPEGANAARAPPGTIAHARAPPVV